MPEEHLPSYDELISSLKQSSVIANEKSSATELFEAADKIYNAYSNKITAKNVNGEGVKVYSDFYDDSGHQIIDLVQEGGGMWGIALVGYAYILEKAGLRFNSLAGTSAGAINTMCLAAFPDSVYNSTPNKPNGGSKSEILAEIIANHDYSDFVDRKKGIMRSILMSYLKQKGNLLLWIMFFVIWLTFSTGLYFLLSSGFINDYISLSPSKIKMYSYLIGTSLAFLPLIVMFMILKGVLGSRFGLNPGKVPQDFIKNILKCNGINTTDDLYQQINKFNILGKVRKEGQLIDNKEKLKKRIVLIASNLTHGRIVRFPERATDYFHDMKIVDPSIYVRASMSIPLFFECVSLHDHGDPANVKMKARFVDGGMLSNFPIREFHNDKIRTPRFPTFGVRLGVSKKSKFKNHIAFFSYILSFISTFRGFYDNDFIDSNSEVGMLVSEIETGKISFLNFAMNQQDKITLFRNGAEAACKHLDNFDWEKYKKIRSDLYDQNITNS